MLFNRWKVNFLVLSKLSDSSSTDGLVVLPIYSGKWWWRLLEIRLVSSTCKYMILLFQILFNIVLFCFDILLQKVKFWKKVYVIYSFFFVRKIIAHMVTFSFYCVVLPLTILVPEVQVPIWGAVYIPSIITILNSVGTPRSVLPINGYFNLLSSSNYTIIVY